jgi:PAS domain S-box-containing protein
VSLTSETDARRRLLALLEAIPVPAAMSFGDEVRDVHINAAFGHILGVDPLKYGSFTVNRGRQLPFRFEIGGKALTFDEAPLVRAARGETIEAVRLDVLLPDGSRRQLLGWAAPLFDAVRGGPHGALCVFQDVGSVSGTTGVEAGQPVPSASEEQFRLMADAMPQLLWTALPDGYLNWANQRWYEYTGLSAEATLGWGWRCAYHPDDLPEASHRLTRALKSGELYEMEARLRARDGNFRWFLIRATPMRDALGSISKWHGSHTDIDDVRRAQRTLQVFAHLGEALSESLGLQATLDAVMQAIVPEFADWAFINLADDTGDLRIAATYHTEPRKSAILQSCVGEIYARSRAPESFDAPRAREPLLYTAATYEDAERVVESDVLERIWQVGFKSVLVAPLIVGGQRRGTLNVAMHESNRAFAASDVPTFKELARRFAPAIANAELYERERLVARSFQQAALPASLPISPGYTFDAIYEAGRAEALIGGDWFDAFRLIDGRIVVSIGDVAGSGLLAAVTMASVRQSIRAVAQVHADPALMLEAADRALRSESPERFVTAFVGVLDPIVGSISYASAGHPPPLYCDGVGHITELAARGLPLGLRELDGGGETNALLLLPGSFLAFYTDGLTESTHDMLEGEARLREALVDPSVTGASSPATAIYDAVLRGVSRDDVAILTISVGEPAGCARWKFDPNDAEAARSALHGVSGMLAARGYPPASLPAAEVILAELIGNLVRYAPHPTEIALEWEASNPVVHVLDRGPGFQFVAKLPMDPYSESGRGLFLIASLADDFHVLRRVDGGSHARVVLRL